jgi:hypothetical protein
MNSLFPAEDPGLDRRQQIAHKQAVLVQRGDQLRG